MGVEYEFDVELFKLNLDDWQSFADYLEAGHSIPPDLRAHIVEVFRGKKRPRGRKKDTRETMFSVGIFLVELEQCGVQKTEAKRLAAEKFGLSERTIERHARKISLAIRPRHETSISSRGHHRKSD